VALGHCSYEWRGVVGTCSSAACLHNKRGGRSDYSYPLVHPTVALRPGQSLRVGEARGLAVGDLWCLVEVSEG